MSTPIPETMKAVVINAPGDVSALQYGEQPTPQITAPNQVVIQVAYTSVNYIDIYHRSGLYKFPTYPATLGRDGVGTVVECGANVKYVQTGDRVAFVFPTTGSYAEFVVVPEAKLFKVPVSMPSKDAVAMMLNGLTSHYLVCDTYPIKPGNTVLIHAGAGGCGTISIQIAKAKGLTVITTVGSEEKVDLVKKCGADHVIVYTKEDVRTRVMEITANRGVEYVLDGVGATTYETSMQCLAKRGYCIFFGNASGPVPPINPLDLTKYGSIFITRPTLADYILSHDELKARCEDLCQMVEKGQLSFVVGNEFTLADIAAAHNCIESRGNTGKIIIKVAGDAL